MRGHWIDVRGSWLFAAVLIACGGTRPPPDRDHVGGITDVDDRCLTLPYECLEGFDFIDYDGCPDPPPPSFELPGGTVELPDDVSRALDGVAADAHHLAERAIILVIVEHQPWETDEEVAARGARVADALIARGAPAARIAVETVAAGENTARVVIGVDGCALTPPLLDTDGDALLDHRDACPDDPEDVDGHLDADGCPDVDRDCHPVDPAAADPTCGDRDHDGTLDAEDRCPVEAGPTAAGGCPRPRAPLRSSGAGPEAVRSGDPRAPALLECTPGGGSTSGGGYHGRSCRPGRGAIGASRGSGRPRAAPPTLALRPLGPVPDGTA